MQTCIVSVKGEVKVYDNLDMIYDYVVDWDEPFGVDLSLSVPEEKSEVLYISDGSRNYVYINGILMST